MGFNFFKKRSNAESPKVALIPEMVPEVVPESVLADTALIAVITAAVAAMLDDKAATGGFIVRRVKRISNAPVWQHAGREEQIYSRL